MAVIAPVEVFYPSSDGRPVAETDIHIQWFVILRGRLKRWFAKKKVYVAGNMLVYFVEGQPKKCFAPDAFVVKNCEPKVRRIFKIWEEGRVPNWVMEITSASTRIEDTRTKFEIYKSLGIKEYFLYDPLGDWLKPRLIGSGQTHQTQPRRSDQLNYSRRPWLFCGYLDA